MDNAHNHTEQRRAVTKAMFSWLNLLTVGVMWCRARSHGVHVIKIPRSTMTRGGDNKSAQTQLALQDKWRSKRTVILNTNNAAARIRGRFNSYQLMCSPISGATGIQLTHACIFHSLVLWDWWPCSHGIPSNKKLKSNIVCCCFISFLSSVQSVRIIFAVLTCRKRPTAEMDAWGYTHYSLLQVATLSALLHCSACEKDHPAPHIVATEGY